MLLVALSVAILVFLELDRERKHLEQNLMLTVTALSKAVDIELETVATGTAMLAASNRGLIDRHDFATLHGNLSRAVSKARLIHHFVLVERSGQQVINTQVPFGAPLPVTRNRDKFADTLEGGRPSISTLVTGTVSGRPEILLTFPVPDRATPDYAFASVISASNFSELLSSLNIPPDWLASIFDSQWNVVARTLDQEKFIGQKVATGLQAQLAREPSGVFENFNLDGIKSVAAYSQSRSTGFGVTIGVPKRLLIRQALEAQVLPGLATALAVFSLLVAWHFGMAMTHRRDTEERLHASLANSAVGFAMASLLRPYRITASMPQYRDKIFDIFQRLGTAADAEGTGIGLTLCRRIVHRFGRNIWVDSALGDGSTFFFTLADGGTEA